MYRKSYIPRDTFLYYYQCQNIQNINLVFFSIIPSLCYGWSNVCSTTLHEIMHSPLKQYGEIADKIISNTRYKKEYSFFCYLLFKKNPITLSAQSFTWLKLAALIFSSAIKNMYKNYTAIPVIPSIFQFKC